MAAAIATPRSGEDEMARQHFRLVYWTIHRMQNKKRLPIDDAEAESAGALGLLYAIRTYDPAMGKFSTHAVRTIETAIIRAIKRCPPPMVRLDAPIGENGETRMYYLPSEEASAERQVEARDDIKRLWAGLVDDRERDIVRRLARGEDCLIISRAYGVSRQAISKAKQKILRRNGGLRRNDDG